MKFVFGIEYDGSMYYGWQKQRSVLTLQGCVETAFSKIADHQVDIVCAGRTDRGVHAIKQIAHFSTNTIRSNNVWLKGVNSLLPYDIKVLWIKEVSSNFNARFSAISRSYRYIILNKNRQSSFMTKYYFYVKDVLDIQKMQYSSSFLLGQHDFTSFKSSGCQSLSPNRKIISLLVYNINDFVIIDITANSFLYHMVRNIVGCLISIGLSKHSVNWTKIILHNKDINKIYSTVPPHGLYFLSASYPNYYSIY